MPSRQRPLTDCLTQGELARLSLVSLGHDMGGERASGLDDILGPLELAALGDTCSLLHKPVRKFEGQLAEATGDPVGTAALSLHDKGTGPLLESPLLAPGICPVLPKTRAFPGRPQCPSQACGPLGAEKGMSMRPICSGQSTPTFL